MLNKTIAAVAALGIVGLASAQQNGGNDGSEGLINSSGLSIKLGIGIPFDDTLSSRTGNTLGMIGLEFQPLRSLLPNSETYFSLEYFFKDTSGSEGYIIPLMINQRFYASQRAAASTRRYGFIGIGVSAIQGDDTDATLTLRGGIGAELGERVFIEAAAYFGESRGGVKPNFISFSAGYRF